MKGAFSDPTHALRHGITSRLLAGTTYEVESGGDPLMIPDLSYAMLKEFHASHYHPSQALFMTAGPVDVAKVQTYIADRVLNKLTGRAPRRRPALAPTWEAPREQRLQVPSQRARDDEFGVQLAWLLGPSSDALTYYTMRLLESALLGDAAAPVRAAMESAGFGRRPALMASIAMRNN